MLSNMSLLVTGGTGSFGKHFIKRVLHQFPQIKRLVVYSRDELKQFQMAQDLSPQKYPQLRYFIGDVRDEKRLKRALEGIDIIIHAAALKQVPAAEYNPMECIKTNILGAENVIDSAIEMGVKKVVALSTDKAAAPINLYGATKLCSDKLFSAANAIRGDKDLRMSVVRYGNVMGSRGSVIPYFLDLKKRGEKVFPITHQEMTRFNITLDQAMDLVLKSINIMWGGEIFVPKIPSYRIGDVAKAINPNCEQELIGIRPGEKIHEEMITADDSINTVEFDDYYVILPSMPVWDTEEFINHFKGKRVPLGFHYRSGTNTDWLEIDEIQKLIKEHVDPSFPIENLD